MEDVNRYYGRDVKRTEVCSVTRVRNGGKTEIKTGGVTISVTGEKSRNVNHLHEVLTD